jgi:hypothetical protein
VRLSRQPQLPIPRSPPPPTVQYRTLRCEHPSNLFLLSRAAPKTTAARAFSQLLFWTSISAMRKRHLFSDGERRSREHLKTFGRTGNHTKMEFFDIRIFHRCQNPLYHLPHSICDLNSYSVFIWVFGSIEASLTLFFYIVQLAPAGFPLSASSKHHLRSLKSLSFLSVIFSGRLRFAKSHTTHLP